MRVLISGAAGFIGSNLVQHIVQTRPDWQLLGLDSLTYAGNLKNLGQLLTQEKIKFFKADIADQTSVQDAFSQFKPELVFHLAAESHVDRSIESAAEFVRTNVLGTQIMLNAAKANGVKRFVHISTDEVYGSLGPTGVFTEETPLEPTSPYAASKAGSDLMVLAAFRTHKFDTVITRCTNNYGPYQFPEKFIPLFISNAVEDKKLPLYGDGSNVRSWIHVEDHCRALVLVAEKGKSGSVYNIGGLAEAELSNKTVASEILKALGKPMELIELVKDRLAHDFRYAVSIDKIQSELGWQPEIEFANGLKTTVQWYLDNSAWWQEIKSGEYRDYYQRHYGDRK